MRAACSSDTVRWMNALRTLGTSARRPDPRLVDAVAALVLASAMVWIEVARQAGAVPVLAAVLCVSTVAGRRRAPAAACAVALVCVVVYRLTGGGPNARVLPFALLLDYYMLGRRSAERGWVPLDLLLLVAAVAVLRTTAGGASLFDLVANSLWWVLIPFATARALRRHSLATEDLQASTARLDREQRDRGRRAAGEERLRVARELHDIVAHSVSVMVIQAVAARRVARKDREVAREALRSVENCGREALREMRRMVGVLRRRELDPTGDAAPGLAQLEILADRARAAGLPVELRIEGERRGLPAGVDLAAYRVVQEALTNTIKHAGPGARADVSIVYGERGLGLEISDTGRGPVRRRHSGAEANGNGLVGMQERVAMYGGSLRTGKHRGGGFQVSARIPIGDAVGAQPQFVPSAPIEGAKLRAPRGLHGWGFDWALALGLLMVCEAELILAWQHQGSLAVDAFQIAAFTVPLAYRRRAPLASTSVVMASFFVMAVTPLNEISPAAGLFVLFIPPYSVAAYEPRARAIAGLVVCVGLLCAVVAFGSLGPAGWTVFAFGLCVASWSTGRAIRSRRLLSERLARAADRLAIEREDRERLAVADERTRIARELQAVVARSVSAMVVQSEAAERLLDLDPDSADDAMAEIERTGREALTDMRRILGVLRGDENAPVLAPQPGVGQLHALVEHVREAGRQIELQVDGEPRPLPASVDLAVYRILQEALADTEDTAAPITVTLRFGEADIALDVTATWPAPVSWPTVAMRERAALCDGQLEVDSVDGTTERLRVRMPGILEGALA